MLNACHFIEIQIIACTIQHQVKVLIVVVVGRSLILLLLLLFGIITAHPRWLKTGRKLLVIYHGASFTGHTHIIIEHD